MFNEISLFRLNSIWLLFKRIKTDKVKSSVAQFYNEEELEENFERGWGPGGQSVNKTANCVILKHIPTGIIVKCQETRILEKNRLIARKYLNDKLDLHFNGIKSTKYLAHKKHDLLEYQQYKKTKRKLELKKQFKDFLNSDETTSS